MNYKTIIHICLLLFLVGCFSQSKNSVVMSYRDFGPQAMSWEVIGKEWWQWQKHGDSNPDTKYDIKVVVYKNITLNKVKSLYPVNKNKNQDYRYIEYSNALTFLDKNIKENVIQAITTRLKQTKYNILKSFNK